MNSLPLNINMKTEEQVKIFLESIKGTGEVDEMAITQYCLQKFNMKVKFNSSNPSLRSITYNEFKEWAENPAPSNGTVIVYDQIDKFKGRFIAIVRGIGINNITAGVFLSPTSGLVTHDVSLPRKGYREPTDDEEKLIYRELSKVKLEWSKQYNRLTEKFSPLSGNYVRIILPNRTEGIGVFNRTSSTGRALMFCIKIQDQPIRYSLKEDIGLADDIKFENMSMQEKKILQQELESVNKVWNPYLKRIESLNLRVSRGDKYYYINDKLNVVQVHESLSSQDNKRFASSNYFNSHKSAANALYEIKHVLKIFHAQPEQDTGDNDLSE